MPIDAIEHIKNAEREAKEMISDAKKRLLEEKEDSTLKAKQNYEGAVQEAHFKAKNVVLGSEQMAREEAKPILQEGELMSRKMKQIPPDKLQQVIEDITERIRG